MSVVLAILLVSGPAAADEEGYIGAAKCGECHQAEYQIWRDSAHADAHISLSVEQQSDATCATCHSMAAQREQQQLAGVQCESCHGPGKYYHPSYVMRDRELARAVGLLANATAQCAHCHTKAAPSLLPFELVSAWAKIAHGKNTRPQQ